MASSIRRIVTGHNQAGKSNILSDGPAPNSSSPPGVPQLVNTVLWVTDSCPASNRGNDDASPKGRQLRIEPPRHGSIFRIVDFPPDKAFEGIDVPGMMAEVGGPHVVDRGNPRHAMFHKTNTVDYAIVLEGEIWALLDEDETLMHRGMCSFSVELTIRGLTAVPTIAVSPLFCLTPSREPRGLCCR
jgi:hypothetical protein